MIDAMTCPLNARPEALDQAEIIWRKAIIRKKDSPEFLPEAFTSPAKWHPVMNDADVTDGDVVRTDRDGRGPFNYRNNDVHPAHDNRCPCQSAIVPRLTLAKRALTRPKYHWAIDVKIGDCINNDNCLRNRSLPSVFKGHLPAFWKARSRRSAPICAPIHNA
jgi:nitrite reductase/ring-hydroxylating ferredoxin subunit